MIYRTFGRTGLKVSAAGLGGGGFSRLGLANGKSETEGKMMPPFGNVLSPQAIHDVLAYLRETFLKPARPAEKKS